MNRPGLCATIGTVEALVVLVVGVLVFAAIGFFVTVRRLVRRKPELARGPAAQPVLGRAEQLGDCSTGAGPAYARGSEPPSCIAGAAWAPRPAPLVSPAMTSRPVCRRPPSRRPPWPTPPRLRRTAARADVGGHRARRRAGRRRCWARSSSKTTGRCRWRPSSPPRRFERPPGCGRFSRSRTRSSCWPPAWSWAERSTSWRPPGDAYPGAGNTCFSRV